LGKRPELRQQLWILTVITRGLSLVRIIASHLWKGEEVYFLGGRAARKTLHPSEKAMRFFKRKTVHVRAYVRYRFGKLEDVCQHWRSAPGQMAFEF
jgi:hypothetical protein